MAQEYLNGLASSRPDAAEAVMRLQPLIDAHLARVVAEWRTRAAADGTV